MERDEQAIQETGESVYKFSDDKHTDPQAALRIITKQFLGELLGSQGQCGICGEVLTIAESVGCIDAVITTGNKTWGQIWKYVVSAPVQLLFEEIDRRIDLAEKRGFAGVPRAHRGLMEEKLAGARESLECAREAVIGGLFGEAWDSSYYCAANEVDRHM
jgi:hypothetical protein